MQPVLLHSRLIAFLDVLGFSRLLACENINKVHDKYAAFIDEAKSRIFYSSQEPVEKRPNFAFTQFISDSLVLVSNEIDDVYNVNNFIGAISFLLEMGLITNLPLRGAITKGDFLVDDDRNIFLSSALPELVKMEENQEWSGCIILANAEDIVIDSIFGKCDKKILITGQKSNHPIIYYSVPLKKNQIIDCFVVNYLFFLIGENAEKGIEYLISPKKENTNSLYQYIKTLEYECQLLSEKIKPAVKMLPMKTRSGVRLGFIDKDDKWCQPGVTEIMWHAVGRWY